MILNDNVLYANEGMQLRRKVDQSIYGDKIYLGYTYYINGVLQNPPHLDTPADFEEIDIPEDMIINEET